MHESHIVGDLIARVEAEVDPALVRVTRLTLVVGAFSSISPAALQEGIRGHTSLAWGYVPEVVVDRSADGADPGAMSVKLVSMQMED